MSSYLFVYGTLLNQFDNEFSTFLKSHSRLKGRGVFQGKLYKIDWYPGVTESTDEQDKVYGQVLEITSEVANVLNKLDEYEGVGSQFPNPNQFIRKNVDIALEQSKIECWIYLYNHPTGKFELIKSGDFLL